MSLFRGKVERDAQTPPDGGSKGDRASGSKVPQPENGDVRARTKVAAATTDQKRNVPWALGESSRSGRKTARGVPHSGGEDVANIGKSVVVKGDLSGDEDLEIEGRVEGQVDLPNHQLTIGAHGRVKAQVEAKTVVIIGHVSGNVIATERCEVQASGVVDGDISAPRLLVQEGAVVNGSIAMGDKAAKKPAADAPGTSAPQPEISRRTG